MNEVESAPEKVSLAINLKVVVVLLLAIIGGMLLLWKPWTGATGKDRTVEVTGEAKVSAKPDQFVFYPSYQFEGADQDAALDRLAKKSEAVVAGLKKLGVPEAKIKTSSSGYDTPKGIEPAAESTFTTQLTVTVDDEKLAQKVQDYLLTTSPTGAITPSPGFSDELRRRLESEARDEATKDARTKAEQMAQNLGFSLGKVKSISDQAGFGIIAVAERGVASDSAKGSLGIHPGENDLTYSVRVVYFIR